MTRPPERYRFAGVHAISRFEPRHAGGDDTGLEILRVVVTGGAGFIGSALVRKLLQRDDTSVAVVDKLTYAACPEALAQFDGDARYRLLEVDVCDTGTVRQLLSDFAPSGIMHLAAETHVDRSIDRPADFVQTNVLGTCAMLEAALDYWRSLPAAGQAAFRFHHVSTDEVFGSLVPPQRADVDHPYRPNSPYAASKAAADHFVRAWQRTYGLPVVTSYCSNNYGPYQFPEKFIPLSVVSALQGKPIRIYGSGQQSREWIHVDDHAEGLCRVFEVGASGHAYNLSSRREISNLELIHPVCDILEELRPSRKTAYRDLITHVADRPGHDQRYALETGAASAALDWHPDVALEDGLRRTVRWYLDNADWWQSVLATRYGGERLGGGAGVAVHGRQPAQAQVPERP